MANPRQLGGRSGSPTCTMQQRPPLLISHSSHEEDADAARLALVDALSDAGFEVLVSDRLVPGSGWDREIRSWLGRCWGAVILFSPAAVESEYVRMEVEILMQRRFRLGGHQFPVVPVVVAHATPAQLATEPWLPSGVAELDMFKWDEDPLERILARFEPIRALFAASPYRDLDLHLVQIMQEIAEETVRRAAARLDLPPGEWEHGFDIKLAFARRLLDCNHEDQLEAVRILTTADATLAGKVYRAVAPWSWIAAEAADHFRTHCHPPNALQCVGIDSTNQTTCERYVRRADWRWTSGDIAIDYGETWIQDIVNTARDVLCKKLNLPLGTQSIAIRSELEMATVRNIVLRLPAEVAEATLVKRLREEFGNLVIVVVGAAGEIPAHSAPIVRIEPQVDPGREAEMLRNDEVIEAEIRQLEMID